MGTVTFDLDTVAELVRLPAVAQVFQLRQYERAFRRDDFDLMRQCLTQLLGQVHQGSPSSLEALAVEGSIDFPHASSLIVNVLAGHATLDYAALAVPPF
jgi:hypothetical protein